MDFLSLLSRDGDVVAWSWAFGDGNVSTAQHPSHVFGAAGTYTVGLTVTDDGGAEGVAQHDVTVSVSEPPPPPPPSEGLQLTADGFKETGQHVVRLVWGGGSGGPVDVFRDGTFVETVPSVPVPSYEDRPGGRGKATYVYRVCETGTSDCSPDAEVVF